MQPPCRNRTGRHYYPGESFHPIHLHRLRGTPSPIIQGLTLLSPHFFLSNRMLILSRTFEIGSAFSPSSKGQCTHLCLKHGAAKIPRKLSCRYGKGLANIDRTLTCRHLKTIKTTTMSREVEVEGEKKKKRRKTKERSNFIF